MYGVHVLCVHVYGCTCEHVYMKASDQPWVSSFAAIHLVFLFPFSRVCVCLCMYMHVCIYVGTHGYMCAYAHVWGGPKLMSGIMIITSLLFTEVG